MFADFSVDDVQADETADFAVLAAQDLEHDVTRWIKRLATEWLRQ